EDAEPVRVDELVAEAMDRCRHQAGTKQITMAYRHGRAPAPERPVCSVILAECHLPGHHAPHEG
ncbi:hypothetical protein ACWCPX_43415, partial [Streptomyces olivaceoviridis]